MSREAWRFVVFVLVAVALTVSGVAWVAHDHHQECQLILTTKKTWADSVDYAVSYDCKREMHR